MKLNQPHYVDVRDTQMDLNGEWRYCCVDAPAEAPQTLDYALRASLPDSVYWNLFDSGVLPHPYVGTNSKAYHWVDEQVWYYRRSFSVPAEKHGGTAILCFDGVAYYCRVWLNGVLLGEHEGMFGGPYVEVSKRLAYGGENELIVEVKACNYGRKAAYACRNEKGQNREIVPWNIARDGDTSNGDLIVMGIWRGVRLAFLPPFHLARPYLTTREATADRADLRLEAEIVGPEIDELHPFYGMWDEEPSYDFAYQQGLRQAYLAQSAAVRISLREKNTGACVYESRTPVPLIDYANSLRADAYPESQFFECEFAVERPKRWWPHDMGEPFLYTVTLTLLLEGTQVDELSFDCGIRTVRAVPTAGPRAREWWAPFQFVVNGRSLFLKGVNWMPTDALYREREAEYRWSLQLARNAGIHMVRVWSGGGKPEADAFYRLCDELGIMVWQDHFIANTSHTEGWPPDVLEAQEAVNLYRIRNHASLAVHCGGNEFNAYSAGNAAALFIIRRTVRDLDPRRIFYDTTPNRGSAHIYRDMEPTWYRQLYKDLPFVAETGIHSFPGYKALQACLSPKECTRAVPELTGDEFRRAFPELLNHFAEYVPQRVPRMLARASQIADLSRVDLRELAEATHIAASEYYAILIQALRENAPVTAGVMPWVFRRPWTTVGIQLVDGSGDPLAPYYAVKRAYASPEAHLALEHISFAPGEEARLPIRVCNEYHLPLDGYAVQVKAWSPEMNLLWAKTLPADAADAVTLEQAVAAGWADRYFFLTVTLLKDGRVTLRQLYWPKCLSILTDPQTRARYRTRPQGNFRLDRGPWLKPQVAACGGASLRAQAQAVRRLEHGVEAELRVTNAGDMPAFPVTLQSTEPGSRLMAEDNGFWLEPGETRALRVVLEGGEGSTNQLAVSAWNAAGVFETI